MNAVAKDVAESTEAVGTALTLTQRAAQALHSQETESKLVELAAASKTIVTITNRDGYLQCHASRMSLKNMRVTIEKTGKAARDEANKFRDAVIKEEARLIGIIEPEEARLKGIQDEYDGEQERQRQAKILAEQQRVAALQAKIADIQAYPLRGAGQSAAALSDLIADLTALDISEAVFAEWAPTAATEQRGALDKLGGMLQARVALETEQARLEQERKDREAAEAVERERVRVEGIRLAEEAEKLRVQREAQDAEAARVAEAQAAEAKRLADAQAELDRQRAEQEKAARQQQETAAAEQRARDEAAATERAEQARKQREQDERIAFTDFREAITDLRVKVPAVMTDDSIAVIQQLVLDIEAVPVSIEVLGAWYDEAQDLRTHVVAGLNNTITQLDNARRTREDAREAFDRDNNQAGFEEADSQGGTVETAAPVAPAFTADTPGIVHDVHCSPTFDHHYPGLDALIDGLAQHFDITREIAAEWLNEAAAEL